MTIRASPAGVSSNAANLIGVLTAFVVITGGGTAWRGGPPPRRPAQPGAGARVTREQAAGARRRTAPHAL